LLRAATRNFFAPLALRRRATHLRLKDQEHRFWPLDKTCEKCRRIPSWLLVPAGRRGKVDAHPRELTGRIRLLPFKVVWLQQGKSCGGHARTWQRIAVGRSPGCRSSDPFDNLLYRDSFPWFGDAVMGRPFSEIAFAPSAKAVPQRFSARETYECVVKTGKMGINGRTLACRILRSAGTLVLHVLLFRDWRI
jgi:hypothetical protein